MATSVVVRHRVADFDKWKPAYEEHGAVRKSHGCTGTEVLRDIDDPNEVLVVTQWPDRKAAKAFRDDPSLKEAMQNAGVISPPRIEIYDEADV